MDKFKKGDRVKTNSDRVKGIVVDLDTMGPKVLVKKSTSYTVFKGSSVWYKRDEVKKCSRFFSGLFLGTLVVLGACIIAPILMNDVVTWCVYGFSFIAAFGGRAYQYFVQWR